MSNLPRATLRESWCHGLEAIHGYLDALGVPADALPAGLDQRAPACSRPLDKHVLVVLDNARDAEQVRPLLPGGPSGGSSSSTGRAQLTGLVAAEGAYALALGLLTEAEGEECLRSDSAPPGWPRSRKRRLELDQVLHRLPLALAVAAARRAGRPRAWPWRARCGSSGMPGVGSMRWIRGGCDGQRASSVSSSLDGLPAPGGPHAGLLGVHAGPDIAAPPLPASPRGAFRPARAELRELATARLRSRSTPRAGLPFTTCCYPRLCHRRGLPVTEEEAGRHAARGRGLDSHCPCVPATPLLSCSEPLTRASHLPRPRPGIRSPSISPTTGRPWPGSRPSAAFLLCTPLISPPAPGPRQPDAWRLPLGDDRLPGLARILAPTAPSSLQRTALGAATRLGCIPVGPLFAGCLHRPAPRLRRLRPGPRPPDPVP